MLVLSCCLWATASHWFSSWTRWSWRIFPTIMILSFYNCKASILEHQKPMILDGNLRGSYLHIGSPRGIKYKWTAVNCRLLACVPAVAVARQPVHEQLHWCAQRPITILLIAKCSHWLHCAGVAQGKLGSGFLVFSRHCRAWADGAWGRYQVRAAVFRCRVFACAHLCML